MPHFLLELTFRQTSGWKLFQKYLPQDSFRTMKLRNRLLPSSLQCFPKFVSVVSLYKLLVFSSYHRNFLYSMLQSVGVYIPGTISHLLQCHTFSQGIRNNKNNYKSIFLKTNIFKIYVRKNSFFPGGSQITDWVVEGAKIHFSQWFSNYY